jgi:ATP-dependent protease HslVU (ClpYQ) peptidase subunit
MTAIIAYKHDNKVYMAGDSRAMDGGWSKFTISGNKVFEKGNLLIGVAGLVPPLQTIRDIYEPLEHEEEWTDTQYMTRLSMDIQVFLKEHELVMMNDDYSGVLLLGYKGKLYYMTPDSSMNEIREPGFFAGSGGLASYAAFNAIYMLTGDVKKSMLLAMDIVSKLDFTVEAPFYVLEKSWEDI